MPELTTDRSGRTLKDYRQLYWDGKERIKELEAKKEWWKDTATKSDHLVKYKIRQIDELQAQLKAVEPYIQHTRICASNYHDVVTPHTGHPPRQPCDCGLAAIGEQE